MGYVHRIKIGNERKDSLQIERPPKGTRPMQNSPHMENTKDDLVDVGIG